MKRFLFAVAMALNCAVPTAAQNYMGGYYTTIGPQDFLNSSGVRLQDLCTIVQQDRENRAIIGESCRSDPKWTYIRDQIMSRNITPIRVGIFGSGGRISYVYVGTTAG